MITRPNAPVKSMTLNELQALLIIHEFHGKPLFVSQIVKRIHTFNPLLPNPCRRMIQYALKDLRETGWIERQLDIRFSTPGPGQSWADRNGPNRYFIAPLIGVPHIDLLALLPDCYRGHCRFPLRGAIAELLYLAYRSAQRLGKPFSSILRAVFALVHRLEHPVHKVIQAWKAVLAQPWPSYDSRGKPIRDPPAYLYRCLETELGP